MPMLPAPGPSADDFGGLRVYTKQPYTYVDAELLLGTPGLERLDPARLYNHTRRKVLLDWHNMNVLSDVAALTFFKYSKDARTRSMNPLHVNKLIAPSLKYMAGGPEVS